jgi:hypothetical protein
VHIPLAPLSIGEPTIDWYCVMFPLIADVEYLTGVMDRYNTTEFDTLLQRLGAGSVGVMIVDGPPAACATGDCALDYARCVCGGWFLCIHCTLNISLTADG